MRKKLFNKLIIIGIIIYVTIVLFNQQETLSTYNDDKKELQAQIEEANQYKEELQNTKENVNSLEFIEEIAREKLDMYLPNEKVYLDKGM